MFIAVTHFFPF
jgi:histone chaperone ASF1